MVLLWRLLYFYETLLKSGTCKTGRKGLKRTGCDGLRPFWGLDRCLVQPAAWGDRDFLLYVQGLPMTTCFPHESQWPDPVLPNVRVPHFVP